MLQWGLYTMIFGYLLGADNAAHGVGFAAGALLGLLFHPRWLRSAKFAAIRAGEGLVGVGAAVTAVLLVFIQPGFGASPNWTESFTAEAFRAAFEPQHRFCELNAQGHQEEALKGLQEFLSQDEELVAEGEAVANAEILDALCRQIDGDRKRCEAFSKEGLRAFLDGTCLSYDSAGQARMEQFYRAMCAALLDR